MLIYLKTTAAAVVDYLVHAGGVQPYGILQHNNSSRSRMASSSFVPRPVLLLEDIEGLGVGERSNSITPVYQDDDGGGGGGGDRASVVAASDERGRRGCAQASPASRSYLEVLPRRGLGDGSNDSAPAALHSQYRQR